MIEVTGEMREAFRADRDDWCDEIGCRRDDCLTERLAAVLAIVERELRRQIAYRIRAELVCCEIFEQTHDTPAWVRASQGPHSICYWGEAAARLAAGEVA